VTDEQRADARQAARHVRRPAPEIGDDEGMDKERATASRPDAAVFRRQAAYPVRARRAAQGARSAKPASWNSDTPRRTHSRGKILEPERAAATEEDGRRRCFLFTPAGACRRKCLR